MALTVYSSDYDPRRLHSTDGDTDISADLVESVVRFGDRPMDLYVDAEAGRVLWTFRGRHSTTAVRTGYFIADYRTDDDLFRGLEAELRSLHDSDDWTIPAEGDLRWDAGFELWRLDPDFPGLDDDERTALLDALDSGKSLAFGVSGYFEALQTVRAVADAEMSASTGVAGTEATRRTQGDDDQVVDLLIRPGAAGEFIPRSEAARDVLDRDASASGSKSDSTESSSTGVGQTSIESGAASTEEEDRTEGWSPIARAAMGLIVGLLALSLLSFVTPRPVHPITGLSTVAAVLGSAVGFPAIIHQLWGTADVDNFFAATLTAYSTLPDRSVAAVAYGTLVGYLFPFGCWEFGKLVDPGGWIFGYITTPGNAFPSVALLLAGMAAVGGIVGLQVQETQERELDRSLLVSFAVGHLFYGVLVFLATGLASTVWFGLIPSI